MKVVLVNPVVHLPHAARSLCMCQMYMTCLPGKQSQEKLGRDFGNALVGKRTLIVKDELASWHNGWSFIIASLEVCALFKCHLESKQDFLAHSD